MNNISEKNKLLFHRINLLFVIIVKAFPEDMIYQSNSNVNNIIHYNICHIESTVFFDIPILSLSLQYRGIISKNKPVR